MRKHSYKATLTTLAFAAMVAGQTLPATAKETIVCQHPGLSEATITLNDYRVFGRVVDCLAGDFIADMTPCAPDGAYGLSAPTGSADLVKIVDRWQDYADHIGGITSHYVTATAIYFAGGSNHDTEGYKDDWTFKVSRLTGTGVLKRPGVADTSYTCGKSKPKF